MTAVVIGAGNRDRGDDGVGPVVADEVRPRAATDVRVVSGLVDPGDLIGAWSDARVAVVVDALAPRGEPGRVRRFDAVAAPLPGELFATSTHGLGVAHAVELARALGMLPPKLVVFGVEAASFEAGRGLGVEVARAVGPVADAVLEEIAAAALR